MRNIPKFKSLSQKIKKYLTKTPKNTNELIKLLRDFHNFNLYDLETLNIIENAIHLNDLKVRDVMLPKNLLATINENESLEKIIEILDNTNHSRYPVIDSNKNSVIGILHTKDLLRYLKNTNKFNIHDVMRQASIVPESKRLNLLLREFRTYKSHMAIVVDEYGSIIGIVTLENILEQIIGNIEDEFDTHQEPNIKIIKPGHYNIQALTPLDEFNITLDSNLTHSQCDTIGGLILAKLGHVAARGEQIIIEPFIFTIINSDSRRIKLLDCIDKRFSNSSNND